MDCFFKISANSLYKNIYHSYPVKLIKYTKKQYKKKIIKKSTKKGGFFNIGIPVFTGICLNFLPHRLGNSRGKTFVCSIFQSLPDCGKGFQSFFNILHSVRSRWDHS